MVDEGWWHHLHATKNKNTYAYMHTPNNTRMTKETVRGRLRCSGLIWHSQYSNTDHGLSLNFGSFGLAKLEQKLRLIIKIKALCYSEPFRVLKTGLLQNNNVLPVLLLAAAWLALRTMATADVKTKMHQPLVAKQRQPTTWWWKRSFISRAAVFTEHRDCCSSRRPLVAQVQ